MHLFLLTQWKPIELLLEKKTDNKHNLERFSQMLVKVESVAGAIEISVVIVYCTSCTSEKKKKKTALWIPWIKWLIVLIVKTALKGQPPNDVQPSGWWGQPHLLQGQLVREICLIVESGGFCPGKKWRGAGWTALQSTGPLLSPGTPSSRTVQTWLDKNTQRRMGRACLWKAITVNRPGDCVITAAATREVFGQSPHHPVEFCSTLEPCRDRDNMELENQTSSSLSPSWIQIQHIFTPKCTRGIFTDCKALSV